MMLHIKQQAQTQLPETIDQAVIGRPINFQGLGGDDANAQAQGILERAAKRAGFRDVVFQFEPVAAGLDFEATLNAEKTGAGRRYRRRHHRPFAAADGAAVAAESRSPAKFTRPQRSPRRRERSRHRSGL